MTPSAPTPEQNVTPPKWIGGPLPPPNAEELAAFEAAMNAARERFIDFALAEAETPIRVGWWPPGAEPPAPRADEPNRDVVASAPG